ncbi:MAG: sigma-70 family RNA polymerase sigma factor [Saprospiraceae bacterium]|nr:sigma-70 family RNA polymerase sigma factor [Saprospiraceae bacterium]
MDDDQAISLFLASRDNAYFDILFKRYSGKVYAKCISILKDEVLAGDATQEIFTKIFLNLSKFTGKSKFSTWLYSITYNYCIDQVRKQKKGQGLFSDEIENAPDVVEEVQDEELLTMEINRLKEVLDNLPEGDKAVLIMKYSEEMSIIEIAETFQKSESAIKMKLMRAKQKAKQVYDELYGSN